MSDQLLSDLASLKINRTPEAPAGATKKWLVSGAVVLALSLLGYWIYSNIIAPRFFKSAVQVGEISSYSPVQAATSVSATGYVMPKIVSQAAAKVGGRVEKVLVKQGEVVKAGQVLLEIDRSNVFAQTNAAKSRAAAARAAAKTARAQTQEARNQSQLAERMFSQGVGSESTAIDAKARLGALDAAALAADAQAKAAEAEVATLQTELANYTMISPINGTIVSKPPEVGEMVGPAFAGVASQLGGIEIVDFASLVVEADVSENRLHLVKLGARTEISLEAYPEERLSGRVLEIVPRINRAKATVTVRVSFDQLSPNILPDMSARVSFLSAELDETQRSQKARIVVPKDAVVEKDGASVVFTLDEDSKVHVVQVKVGEAVGSGLELLSGPAVGQKVVLNPAKTLRDGAAVNEKK